ncbi:MAG: hypothetical protein ACLQMT_00110 [Candidatus Acidiferrales bacterium]
MSSLFSNPEFLRYWRSQLRANKLVSTAIVCLALSFTIGFFALHGTRDLAGAGATLLRTAFILQALVLAAGGGIACLNAIYSEKEQNTFDYQRITRLTAGELALGKLFGAPLLMYFICLCLTPLTIYAAVIAHAHSSLILAAYIVLLVASVTFHTFTLLLSLLTVKGSQVFGIVLVLLVLGVASMDNANGLLRLHPLGPFEAVQYATAPTWQPLASLSSVFRQAYDSWLGEEFTDVFFGHRVDHFAVLVTIDLLLAGWFFLAIVRNIKKDPQQYEVYSPLQFLGFALFLNFLFVGFYNANWSTPADAQSVFLAFDLVIFFFLGVALLRSRERMRSLVQTSGEPASNLWNSLWPAPVLMLGALLASFLIVARLNYSHPSLFDWSLGFAALRCLAFALWIVSNLQFLQCMNLRRGKHPLVMAVLYLSIYYVCASFLLAAFGCFTVLRYMPVSSLFVPSAIFLLEPEMWGQGPALWVAGFVIQLVLIGLFFYLQGLRIRQLKSALTGVYSKD